MASSTSHRDSTIARQTAQGAEPRPRNMTHPRKRAVTAFDPASLLILEKLNEVLRRLDENSDLRFHHAPVSHGVKDSNDCGGHEAFGAAALEEGPEGQVPRALDGLHVPSSFSSTDSVLNWPIFDGQFGPCLLAEELLIAEHALSVEPDNPLKIPADYVSLKRGGTCDDDIPNLVIRFLRLVHIKNPILDSKSLRQFASSIAEHGLGWDSSSCLVLLACALGAIASPYDARTGPLEQHAPDPPHFVDSDRVAAENYYRLARRRLGLLDRSLVAAQCFLLSGIYLMYIIRPLDAQSHFHQAASIYATRVKGQVALQRRGGVHGPMLEPANRRLEQSLYWTCFKSECEIRLELDLQVSELATLAYPYMFPSPPSPATPAEASQEHSSLALSTPLSSSSLQQMCQSSTFGTLQEVEEQSWYYYLSEIALRRIGNRVSHYFYKEDYESWSRMNVREAAAIAEDLEMQLDNWELTAPTQYRGGVAWEEKDELRCMIRGRYIDIKCLLYRPFLYYAIHHRTSDLESNQIIDTLAQKALKNILELTATVPFYHRNHGTWLSCRMVSTCALLLLGARKSGLIPAGNILRDSHWEGEFGHSFQTCLDILKYWESESPDIAKAREVIASLQDRF
ncbi:hypothetical protein BO82DRAFT_389805 [Aspergillus uvarum CBS 121591]|uniref:Transcription factor domain-containing protein n=1 Tax=Aspergillus uvarum CBS 121591 TaxID=1448315 RepID=A0A319E114_9EURO|nr:hypothetical protein BO82DRAFT_389805 [Aspergillus uvarum CBS 121591]PYH84782.1 hypothetical protein BO82DRAFT_389805 [Aspergillus uvarum CBS 121591]